MKISSSSISAGSVMCAIIFGLSFASLLIDTHTAYGASGDRKIVVWKEGVTDVQKNAIIQRHGQKIQKIKDLSLIHGSVLNVQDAAELSALKSLPEIESIEDDALATAAVMQVHEAGMWKNVRPSATTSTSTATSTQVLPWGIDRIDAEMVWPWPYKNKADPIKVGIIDTGIASWHPDLFANIKGGVNTIKATAPWNDNNGHGSHVAGTVAARNNAQGVVGGAHLADLYAIKVLGADGYGYYSDIIEGLQWAVANNLQVVNMSLGGSSDRQAFHDAIIAARQAGVVIVASAGNDGAGLLYPAAYPEVIAVAATDSTDVRPTWSNFGSGIDIAAPGVSVFSTYKGKEYATLSGTSMAAPHVTATVALLLNTPVGANDVDQDGRWDPDEVQNRLQNTATDLGEPGFDEFYGWGLVNAFKAATGI